MIKSLRKYYNKNIIKKNHRNSFGPVFISFFFKLWSLSTLSLKPGERLTCFYAPRTARVERLDLYAEPDSPDRQRSCRRLPRRVVSSLTVAVIRDGAL